MSKEISAQDLMEQRFEALSRETQTSVMSKAEEDALLAGLNPPPASKENRPIADEFTLHGRRVIAPLLTKAGTTGTVCQIKRLSHKHMAMMDYMLANPAASMLEVATAFGVTLAWFSTVRNSDLFRQTYNERRAVISERQQEIVSEQLSAITTKGLKRLEDALDDEEIGVKTVLAITDLALKHSGLSSEKPKASVVVNNNTTNTAVITADDEKALAIQQARARILARAVVQNEQTAANRSLPDIEGEVIR